MKPFTPLIVPALITLPSKLPPPARLRRCFVQGVTPTPNSAIDMLMRATNKDTGRGLMDVQIAAQSNTLIAGGRCSCGGVLWQWQGAACCCAAGWVVALGLSFVLMAAVTAQCMHASLSSHSLA